MTTTQIIIRYAAAALVVIILGALGGWYFFVHSANTATQTEEINRGLNAPAPSFSGSTGSTYQNEEATLNNTSNASGNTSGNSSNVPASGSSAGRLWQASQVPVAGFGWVSGPSPKLYFAERSSGYVFEVDPTTHTVTRLSNTLRPQTYEALFALDGSVIERQIDDSGTIITFAGTISTSTTPTIATTSSSTSLPGTLLSNNVSTIGIDPVSDTIYYMIPNSTGVGLVSSNWTGLQEKHISTLTLSQWRIVAPGDGSVVLVQKPADNVEGYAFHVQKDGSLAPLAQGPGLTVLPHPSSSALLFGESANGSLSLFGQSSASAPATSLSLTTVADKCAWAPGAKSLIAYCGVPQSVTSQQFLDDWYKGATHTSDQWWEINLASSTPELLESPTVDINAALDVKNPSVDPSGTYIAFINAADQSLWILQITK
jgi:hypothetical protein